MKQCNFLLLLNNHAIMTSRRNFIKNSSLASLALPFIKFDTSKDWSLKPIIETNKEGEPYWEAVRKMFPLKEGQTYFNNGTMGPTPGYVLEKMMHHMMYWNTEAATIDYKNGSGPELLSGYFPYVSLREKLAKIIHCDYKEISITQNATVGMNLVGHGLKLNEGDEIINTNQEHGGGFGVWQLLAKKNGCVYKQAVMPVPANDPQEIVDAIFAQVTSKTKVIAVPHIVSVYGTVMPVAEICST